MDSDSGKLHKHGFARQQYCTCIEREWFIKVAHTTCMYMLRMNHTVAITALKPYTSYRGHVSPEDTRKSIRIYMGSLILGVNALHTCFSAPSKGGGTTGARGAPLKFTEGGLSPPYVMAL